MTPVALGADANPVLRLNEKGETLSGGYSNEFVPPFPVPGADGLECRYAKRR